MQARVKICGLTRGRDVLAAVSCGADAVGFVFAAGSKRVIDPKRARKLVQLVPAFVARVGLFLDQDAEQVGSILAQVPLSLLQFHGREDAAYCRQFGLPYVKAVSMNDGLAAEQAVEQAEGEFPDAAALLMDSHEPGGLGGTGRAFDWKQIGRTGGQIGGQTGRPLILAGGLTPNNVRAAVRLVKPWAVDVSSGVEEAPGIKNAEAMRRFIEQAKSEYPSE
jgi:phosphoribosylanthranilate isomerase